MREEDCHWKELVRWRYEDGSGNWCIPEVSGNFDSGAWKGNLNVKELV